MARAGRAEGRIEVVVVPWGRVWIDGQDVGRSPYRGRLPSGSHRVEGVAGELRAERVVRVEPGRSHEVVLSVGE